MSRPLDLGGLPENVQFANWDKHQAARTNAFARIWGSFIYDAKIIPPGYEFEAARGVLVTGIVIASLTHGKVSIRDWLHQVSRKKRAILFIKSWLDNGLLISQCTQVVSSTYGTKIDIPAAAPPAVKKRAPRAKRKPVDDAPALALRPTTWLEPYRVVWEAVCGEASFAAVAGQAAKFLRPLDKAHGPELIAAHLARYLADTGPGYRNLARFAANWGAFGPGQVLARSTDDQATAALAVVKRVMGEHKGWQYTPQSAWDAFDRQTRAGISAAGGLRAIWESASESGLTRVFTDGYRNGRLNGNGAHAH